MEGMYILEAGEAIENGLKFVAESLRGEFNLSCVETCAKCRSTDPS